MTSTPCENGGFTVLTYAEDNTAMKGCWKLIPEDNAIWIEWNDGSVTRVPKPKGEDL
jgi:hypothetical protein